MRALRAWGVLVVALAPAIASGAFDPQAMREKYVVGSSHHTIGFTGVSVRDVDGLPGDEILIGYLSMWHLLRWDTKTESFAQLGFYEAGVGNIFGGGGLLSVRFADFADGEPLAVVVLGETGRIGRFDQDGSLRTTWNPGVPSVEGMLVADLDSTPGDEIVLITCSEITVWDFGASAPLARLKLDDCASVLVAQLDSDPQLEIVLGEGTVIDSRTMQTQWRYPIGFGYAMTSGDINGDRIPDLIACASRRCTAFDVVQQSTLWETYLPYPDEWGPITAADVDSDGRVELFGGTTQHGSILRLDGATGVVAAQFKKTGGTNFVVVANLDGDCDHEVIWARDGDNTGIDTLHVSDPVALAPIWSGVPEDRGSSGIAFADFAGTGDPQILWTSNGASIQRFVGFDPSTRFLRQSASQGTPYAEYFPLVAAAQLDADPAVEYVLPVNANYYNAATITVFDGATHNEQWSLRVEPDNDDISALTAGDLSGDGVADIVVGLSIEYFPSDHPQTIAVVDGATRKLLWRTTAPIPPAFDIYCDGCIAQVAIADLEFDGIKEVLAVVPTQGLYCFDGRSGALRWHKPELNGAWAFAVADVDPSPGAEILIPRYAFQKISVLDAAATTVLREKDVRTTGPVLSLQPVDLDGDGAWELVTAGDAGLAVLSATTLDVLWSGGWVLPWLSIGNQFVVADVDGDSTTEIVVPSAHSLRVFEYRPATVDTMPPSFRTGAMSAAAVTGCCALSVQWSPASDMASMPVRYRVYRSITPDFTLGRATLVAETASETYMDRTLSGGATYFYAVTAVDSEGNESSVALRTSAAAPESCMVRRRIVRHR